MKSIVLLLLLLSLVGCQSPSVTQVQVGNNSDWIGGGQYQVLVVSNVANPAVRRHLEDSLARLLREEGVNAGAGYTVIPKVTDLSQQMISDYLGAEAPAGFLYISVGQVTTDGSISESVHDSVGEATDWDVNVSADITDRLFVSGYPDPVWLNRVTLKADTENIKQAVNKYVAHEIEMMKTSQVVERFKSGRDVEW